MIVFPTFVVFIFKLDANFPSLQMKSAHFFDFILIFGFIPQKYTSISTISWEFDEVNQKNPPISIVSGEN